MPLPTLYSKDSTDNLLAAKLDLAGGTMTGGLTLSATGIIFSDATTLTTAPAGSALAADQLTAGVVTANPTAGPTTAGDVLQYDGTDLIWAAGGGGGGVAWGAITGTLSSQTDLQTALDGKLSVKSVYSATPHTLVAGDTNNIVYSTGAVTVPTDATYNFPVGTVILVCDPSSTATIVPEFTGGGGGIQPSINNSQTSVAVNYGVTLVKIGADNWVAF